VIAIRPASWTPADVDRFIGVKDISAVRLSLPAQLCEPMGNLEYVFWRFCVVDYRYWNYLDRPDYFVRYSAILAQKD